VVRPPDGELEFRRPDGRVLPDVPPAAVRPDDPIEALYTDNFQHGLHIDAQTGRPGWSGERLDVGWAIDVLHPLANPVGRRAAVITP
jgi:hypothetical protein